MLKFLLWNLNKKPLQASVAALARRYDVDIIVLLENEIPPGVLLRALNPQGTGDYYYSSVSCLKVHVFSRFLHGFVRPIHETDRLTIRHVTLPGRADFLMAAVHFFSKIYSAETQVYECANLADEIIRAEKQVGHDRTILMGDLNMNPFDVGVVSARGLHATMSRTIAQRLSRTVCSKKYPFFYNPMWNLLGDVTPGPAGTYYYDDSNHNVLFWNMFDQVLLRPTMISAFDHDSLQILEGDGETSFLTKEGRPKKRYGSDHLPVLFGIEI